MNVLINVRFYYKKWASMVVKFNSEKILISLASHEMFLQMYEWEVQRQGDFLAIMIKSRYVVCGNVGNNSAL